MTRPYVVAIDGPAASGKGTLAKRVAEAFEFAYLDTGSLYRAVGVATLRTGGDPAHPQDALHSALSFDLNLVNDPAIRSRAAGEAASQVAAHPGVRDALLAFQRDFSRVPPGGAPGAVLDGRDIGTVVCPNAHVKLFVTASSEARAHRRWLELRRQGEAVEEAQVLQDIRNRDARDAGRASAPMKIADDALLLDTTELSIEEAVSSAIALVANALRLQPK
ncbi:MAG TPA: (d)CMP kinase [Alphaproteobacteria bacterium]|nr:(d)CMP kinase [Alphaproteobacteria bacterium]HAJ46759.1 (d)CMP kinase [Alphaproteobacteria bacterium]